MQSFRFAALIVLTAGVAACAKKPVPAPPPAPVQAPPPGPNVDSIAAVRRANDARVAAAAAAAEAERLARIAADAARLEAARSEARRRLNAVVYFDYDMDEIREDQKATLDAKVAILNANPDLRIRIAGHTDDRGSDEYNLALGQRRAASVRRYLGARGVGEGRFDVESFGEQRPAQQGESEAAWGMNRRAEFEVVAGGNPLRVP